MPPMKPKAPSFLAELFELTGNLKDLPYGDLAKAVMDAGWITALAETAVMPMAGTVLVTFDVMVGKSYDALERLDSITMSMPSGPGPISVAARISARESVIFLLTGRLPPRPEAAAVPPPAPGQMNGGDEHEIDMQDEDVELPGELATLPTAVKVVERREPDGLPIFRDLYEIGPSEADSTGEIVVAVLEEVRSFLGNASAEQVDALAVKNPDLVTFIKDLGTPADAAALRDAVMLRKAELSKGKVEPRRRTSALQRAN